MLICYAILCADEETNSQSYETARVKYYTETFSTSAGTYISLWYLLVDLLIIILQQPLAIV